MPAMTPEATSLLRAFAIFAQDLEAIPEEAFSKSFGPKARTVADIVYEVNLVNSDIEKNIRGEKPADWPEGWIKAPEAMREKDVVLKSFKDTADAVMATAGAITEDGLKDPVVTEHGETTKGERLRFMTIHTWYHSGQLNYIQTLLGDDGWHWQ